jgi:hypothetical protein
MLLPHPARVNFVPHHGLASALRQLTRTWHKDQMLDLKRLQPQCPRKRYANPPFTAARYDVKPQHVAGFFYS